MVAANTLSASRFTVIPGSECRVNCGLAAAVVASLPCADGPVTRAVRTPIL